MLHVCEDLKYYASGYNIKVRAVRVRFRELLPLLTFRYALVYKGSVVYWLCFWYHALYLSKLNLKIERRSTRNKK